MALFPIIQPQAVSVKPSLPLYKEVKWDYENNIPVWKNGNPVIITGKDAVLVWAWKALQVQRLRYPIYSQNYGHEYETLVGHPYSSALIQSEAARFTRECLIINPYIKEVTNIKTSFNGSTLTISARIITVYGEVEVSV